MNNNCYTCFPSRDNVSRKDIILCVDSVDMEKVVRKYMHPTDDIQLTLWNFNAKIKCFGFFRKYEEYKLLRTFSSETTKFTDIKYEKL